MDELDIESFICNIEQTAPEQSSDVKLSCRECGGKLEEQEDGHFTCPNCSVAATSMRQFDDTELHHDEQGRPVYGQRVMLAEKPAKHQVDYGWAWSTDEAIAHILNLQLAALEEAHHVGPLFRPAVTNMWLKYWLQTLAPHIKDEYPESELVPISTEKALKLRDIEVLVKVKEKVMVPLHLIKGRRDTKLIYSMLGTAFMDWPANLATVENEEHDNEVGDRDIDDEDDDQGDADEESISSGEGMHSRASSLFGDGATNEIPDELIREFKSILSNEEPTADSRVESAPSVDKREGSHDTSQNEHLTAITKFCLSRTENLSDDSITVLTLNRSLAFIEATARCLPDDDPLFAADIIRACNQYLIPFYGASKLLPETMRLNSRDKLMFQKTRPPTPHQLTRAASLLINNIYNDEFPKTLPTPDLKSILRRFTRDMNLPRELFQIVKDRTHFNAFQATKPFKLTKAKRSRLPQYDRWAFAVLLHHLKTLFHLGDHHLRRQEEVVVELSKVHPARYFVMKDWLHQISSRLELILRFDPFVLYHPLANLDKLEVSMQLSKYVENLIEARACADIRAKPEQSRSSQTLRAEMANYLRRELPGPREIKREIQSTEELEIPKSIRYPLTDAFQRSQQFWSARPDHDPNAHRPISQDFSSHKVVTLTQLPNWSVYDNGLDLTHKNLKISPLWPRAFRLLLQVGAFLCFCEPVELVNEFRLVEEVLHPHSKEIKQVNRLRKCS